MRLLIVDDANADRLMLRRMIVDAIPDAQIDEVATAKAAMRQLANQIPDCILCDYRLPDLDGLCFVAELRHHEQWRYVPTIMVTGMGSERIATEAIRGGADDYLPKEGLKSDRLVDAIVGARRAMRLKEQLAIHRDELSARCHELERRHEMYQRVVQRLGHALLTPLAAIEEFLSLAMDGIGGPVSDAQGRYLAEARGGCQRLEHEIARMNDIVDTDVTPEDPTKPTADLAIMIADAIEELRLETQLQDIEIGVSVPASLPRVRGDRHHLTLLIERLLRRCMSLAGTPGRMLVLCEQTHSDSRVRVSISANGAIRPDTNAAPTTTVPFHDLPDAPVIIDAYDDGTHFQFTLPLAETSAKEAA